ncbi:hypothetical protein PILCRDRAFT_825103 [Piloderma croceum F 1598]|uniref:Uncharacterized protein n=1 Tax=Piloderma croceum (strain F 1598) TaxID=765440 RepID=A0A0C3AUR4_PILCF|nr:hypothetical protein PILCRDRAFT_825103 [Piloderma croceum F 1598]
MNYPAVRHRHLHGLWLYSRLSGSSSSTTPLAIIIYPFCPAFPDIRFLSTHDLIRTKPRVPMNKFVIEWETNLLTFRTSVRFKSKHEPDAGIPTNSNTTTVKQAL